MSTTSIGNLIERFLSARAKVKGERLSLDFVYRLKGARGMEFGLKGVGLRSFLVLRVPFDDADKNLGLSVTLRDGGDLKPKKSGRLMALCATAGRFIPAEKVAALNRYVRSDESNMVAAQWVAWLFENENPNPRYAGNPKRTHCVYTISDVFNVSARLLNAMQKNEPATKYGRIKGERITIDQRMRRVLDDQPEAEGWSITQWQETLKRSRGGIHKTKTWTGLEAARKLGKVEKRTDRHRNRRKMS